MHVHAGFAINRKYMHIWIVRVLYGKTIDVILTAEHKNYMRIKKCTVNSSWTHKLIFFSFGVNIWSYNEENDTTCDTHLSQANCALKCMKFFFARSICRYYWRNTPKQTLFRMYHPLSSFFLTFFAKGTFQLDVQSRNIQNQWIVYN